MDCESKGKLGHFDHQVLAEDAELKLAPHDQDFKDKIKGIHEKVNSILKARTDAYKDYQEK